MIQIITWWDLEHGVQCKDLKMEQIIDTCQGWSQLLPKRCSHVTYLAPTLINMTNYVHDVCDSESFEIILELSYFSFYFFRFLDLRCFGGDKFCHLLRNVNVYVRNEVWISHAHTPTRGQEESNIGFVLLWKNLFFFVRIFLESLLVFYVKCHQHDDLQLFIELNNDFGRIGTCLFHTKE